MRYHCWPGPRHILNTKDTALVLRELNHFPVKLHAGLSYRRPRGSVVLTYEWAPPGGQLWVFGGGGVGRGHRWSVNQESRELARGDRGWWMVTGRGEKKKEGRGRDGKMRGFLSAFSGSYSLHQCSLYFGCFTSGVFFFFYRSVEVQEKVRNRSCKFSILR